MSARLMPAALAAALLSLPAPASALVHTVVPGESLSSVATADGLTVAQLAAANGLPPTAELTAGSPLVIPGQGEAPAAPTETVAAPVASEGDGDSDTDDGVVGSAEVAPTTTTAGPYVVQPGDTLTSIAEHTGTTVAQLAQANHLEPNATLLAGTTLTVSGVVAGANSPNTGEAATFQPVGEAAQGSPEGPPFPTSELVSPETVSSIATANGVPPSLADAIAYDESGFNNGVVSNADARGVMQILPGTWEYIDKELAGEMPLAPASATDNVRGGILLLHSLLQATNGNDELAAAGYYQGLPSVLANGVEPSTQQYVETVRQLQGQFPEG